jgi:hypothetical protein
MAENSSSEEAKGIVERQSQESKGYKTEELKQSLSILKQVEKAQDKITAQISAAAEMSRQLKELDSLIYKEKQKRISIEQKLSTYSKEEKAAVSQIQEKLIELRKQEKSREDAFKEAQKKRAAIRELDVAALNDALVVQLKAMEAAGVDAAKRQQYYEKEQTRINHLQKLNQGIIDRADLEVQRREKILELTQKQILKTEDGIGPKQAEIILLEEALKAQEKTLTQLDDEKKKRAEINDRIGIAGHIAKGSHSLLEKMGIGSLLNMEELTEEMERSASKGASKFQIMGVIGKHAMSQIGKALADPLIVITAIYKMFSSVVNAAISYEKHVFEASKTLGVSVTHAQTLYGNFKKIADTNANLALTGHQMLESYAGMSDSLGFMASTNTEFLTTTTALQRRFGFAAQDMAEMQLYAAETGKDLKSAFNSIVGTAKAQGAKLKISMSEKQVMQAISKTSATVLANFKGDVAALASATVKATKLGVTLDQINNAGKGMLDFESSISKEFEAQLMTGKNINLAKAREYALTGQTEKLMGEITSQIGSQAEWSKMNVLQQESLAEAMGMSKESVDEMFKKQSLANALGKDAAADAATQYNKLKEQGKSHEEIAKIMGAESAQQAIQASVQEKAAAAQERLANAFEKVAAQFLPIIQSVTNWITGIENLEGKMKVIFKIVKGVLGVYVGIKATVFAINAYNKLQELSAKKLTMEESRRLVLERQSKGYDMAKEASKRRQLTTESASLGKKKAANVLDRIGAMLGIVKASSSATAGAGYLGPGALAVGLGVSLALGALLAAVGEGSPPTMNGDTGAATKIEPVNAQAEANKEDNKPKSMGRYAAEKNITTYIYVDPVTGKAVQKQAGQEHFADAQKIITPGG